MRKYRRIVKKKDSKLQGYQVTMIAFAFSLFLFSFNFYVSQLDMFLSEWFVTPAKALLIITILSLLVFILSWNRREKVSHLEIDEMSKEAEKLSKKIKRLFNDKQITDVLKLSNKTRYGDEMPKIYTYVDDSLDEGYVAIENIANYERADREKFEQKMSGILSGDFQRYAVVSSELSDGDSYIIFHFEDTLTSQRFYIKDNKEDLHRFISENKHEIKFSKDLTWDAEDIPHLSVIARSRSGKSVFCAKYLARLMSLQGWIVEYNSAKHDKFVDEFKGQSDEMKIIERAEYWCSVMDERLKIINEHGKEKYSEIDNIEDIAVFFDEIGNLNNKLSTRDSEDKKIKSVLRWSSAINRLTATGGSTGIHIIAISQFATKEGFLPSLARVNCSDAVVMLGGAADSAEERKYLMSGFADMPKKTYRKGEGVARILGAGKKWDNPHSFKTPWVTDND